MIYKLEEVDKIAQNIIEQLKDYRILLFTGSIGAGKTTLIKSIFKLLGIKEPVTSPTFTYVNCYDIKDKKIYHFDLYRLNDYKSFIDMGFLEILTDENNICFIEWPEVIRPLLINFKALQINLDYKDFDSRTISCV